MSFRVWSRATAVRPHTRCFPLRNTGTVYPYLSPVRKGFKVPHTCSFATETPSSSLASLSAVATTSLSSGSLFPPAKLHKDGKTAGSPRSEHRETRTDAHLSCFFPWLRFAAFPPASYSFKLGPRLCRHRFSFFRDRQPCQTSASRGAA
ncbi:hypothetical protein EYF80_053765 [Liparis tanakae]|uniref:Uncharacterized protein n=1 Tax=Liparis tanakae TaxID=230148 RepID=A0A4Z2F591_9TELE|nr:hypothetical protein EYF80_053765 [Liparis tanakae]